MYMHPKYLHVFARTDADRKKMSTFDIEAAHVAYIHYRQMNRRLCILTKLTNKQHSLTCRQTHGQTNRYSCDKIKKHGPADIHATKLIETDLQTDTRTDEKNNWEQLPKLTAHRKSSE